MGNEIDVFVLEDGYLQMSFPCSSFLHRLTCYIPLHWRKKVFNIPEGKPANSVFTNSSSSSKSSKLRFTPSENDVDIVLSVTKSGASGIIAMVCHFLESMTARSMSSRPT